MSDKQTKIDGKVLGVEFTMTLPFNDAESFDSFMGKPGACYERAVQHFLAHTFYARVRSKLVEKLAELTGIERAKTTAEDGSKVKYTETEEIYVRRVMGEFQDNQDRWAEIMAALRETAEAVEPKAEQIVRSRSNAQTRKIAEQIIKTGQVALFAEKRGLNIEGVEGDALVELIAIEYGKVQKEIAEAQKKALGLAL